MPRMVDPRDVARPIIAALVIALGSTAAGAQPAEQRSPDDPFDQAPDLSTPLPPQSLRKFDASKFVTPSTVDWTAKAGIDRQSVSPVAGLRPETWPPGAAQEQAGGIAWANIKAPGLFAWDATSIDSRIDPSQQGKLGLTLSRSIALGSDFAMTLQDGLAITQPVPQTTAPATPSSTAGWGSHIFDENHALRFTWVPAGTTLSVGAAESSADQHWRPNLSAEQKLFGGPFSVTGAVGETATGGLSRSIKAGYKQNW